MKIYQHLRLHIKILSWRLHIMILFTFWNIHTRGIWNVCSQTYRNNRISKKLACFLRNIQTSRVNNSRIFRFKNAEFSRNCFHCFYPDIKLTREFKTNIWRDIWAWNMDLNSNFLISTRAFKLSTRALKLITRNSWLVTPVLPYHIFKNPSV